MKIATKTTSAARRRAAPTYGTCSSRALYGARHVSCTELVRVLYGARHVSCTELVDTPLIPATEYRV
ncbi:hypothetical protein EA462_02320 [Natrarchaeobius halalkaliphilus]|uniref:Uncharacterized protein n=1 Tax=Natrarchaeobius halalkaliphilus TaxID=1679091 RepID=A0A3N6LSV4_9EURY|nr:hypothetical protein EA462_02320 [Natrarchaeobius halalkaliphilus]